MKTYQDIIGDGGSRILEQVQEQVSRLDAALSGVKNIIAVASGKGGVGKSSLSAGLAVTLAQQGRKVGILDADLHGSSIARLLGMSAVRLDMSAPVGAVRPVLGPAGLRMMSVDFMHNPQEPLRWKKAPAGDEHTWRGTLEMSLLREFLSDLEWGELDYLVLDLPPGSDRVSNLANLLSPGRVSVLFVTIPSGLSQGIVEKSLAAARDKQLLVLGLVENMKGYLCTACHDVQPLFSGDVPAMAERLDVPYWGGVPFDPVWSRLNDEGRLADTAAWHEPVRDSFQRISDRLISEVKKE